MRLTNTSYNFELNLKENIVYVLDVMNKTAYREILNDIWNQSNGSDGTFLLSDADKEKNISKEAVCIFNLFEMDCNDRRILNKVYQEIKQLTDENMPEEIAALNSCLLDFLEKSTGMVQYALDYDCEPDVADIFKIFNVRFDDSGELLQERLIHYIRVMNQICHTRIFFFANLKQFFSDEELLQIYEAAFYEKVILILVESLYAKGLDVEKHLIIDADLCMIEL